MKSIMTPAEWTALAKTSVLTAIALIGLYAVVFWWHYSVTGRGTAELFARGSANVAGFTVLLVVWLGIFFKQLKINLIVPNK